MGFFGNIQLSLSVVKGHRVHRIQQHLVRNSDVSILHRTFSRVTEDRVSYCRVHGRPLGVGLPSVPDVTSLKAAKTIDLNRLVPSRTM